MENTEFLRNYVKKAEFLRHYMKKADFLRNIWRVLYEW